ncbi:MAG: hypothetical protein WCP28_17060, partial [Actinomycetes bacterium]
MIDLRLHALPTPAARRRHSGSGMSGIISTIGLIGLIRRGIRAGGCHGRRITRIGEWQCGGLLYRWGDHRRQRHGMPAEPSRQP